MNHEYEFDIYIAKGKRGHRVRFVARVARSVAERLLDGIIAAAEEHGETVGGGFALVTDKPSKVRIGRVTDELAKSIGGHHA